MSNNIFPWEIDEYSKIGINKFKLVGRDEIFYKIDSYISDYYKFLKGIDDIKTIENVSINTFIHHLSSNNVLKQLTVKEYKKYLPNINHFKKYGELCAWDCGVNCRYCYKCAEKIQKVFDKKQEEIRKRTIPMCVISKVNI